MSKRRKMAARRTIAKALAKAPWCVDLAALDSIRTAFAMRSSPSRDLAAAYGYPLEEESPRPMRLGPVVVVPVYGVLTAFESWMTRWMGGTSYEKVTRHVERATLDPNVKTIILDINSPGGEASGAAECAAAILAARAKKHLVAVAHNCMCSGAYWIGSACHEVIATPSGTLGSIGTVRVLSEYSQWDAEAGIKRTVLAWGDHKADGNAAEPLSDSARAAILEHDKGIYDAFVAAVAQARGVTPARVLAEYGQGRVYTGAAAIAPGLANRVATFEAVLAEHGATQQPADPTYALSSLIPPTTPTPAVGRSAEANNPEAPMYKVTAELRAALLALGLIVQGADDDTCRAAVTAFYAGRREQVPGDATQIVAHLQPVVAQTVPAPAPAAAAPVTQPGPVTQPVTQPANPPAAQIPTPQPTMPAAAPTQASDPGRARDLRARGQLLGVSAEQIDEAIDSGISVAQALVNWTAASATTERPASRLQPSHASADKLHAQAVEALSIRAGLPGQRTPDGTAPQANSLRRYSLVRIAALCLSSTGVRIDDMDGEEIGELALQMGQRQSRWRSIDDIRAAATAVTPADFPNILSAVAGKLVDSGHQLAGATYRDWAVQMPSIADFKPHTIHRLGEMGELSYRADNTKADEAKPGEELAWISVDQYAKRFGLTPVMVANDDLGVLTDVAQGFGVGHELTLNRLAVNLLTGNAVAPDGTALFDSTHGNHVDAGGTPDQDELQAIRALFRAQKGASGQNKLNLTVVRLLVPAALESDTEQLLDPQRMTQPVEDAKVNTFRGRVAWSVEAMLDDASTKKFYAFCNPALAKAIVYTFQRGWEGGRSKNFYDDDTGSRVFEFEGRFGVAVNDYRGAVLDDGE